MKGMKSMAVDTGKNDMRMFIIFVAACLVFTFQGCGKKGPPIPPGAIVPPKVSGLSHTIQGDTLTLTWQTPEGRAAKVVDGYDVLRSSTSLDEKECAGCPISFERLARLGSSQTSFTDKLVLGKRYIYKVVAVTSYQVQGRDSKLIRFNYPEVKKENQEEQVVPDSETNVDTDQNQAVEPDEEGGPAVDGEPPMETKPESPEKAE